MGGPRQSGLASARAGRVWKYSETLYWCSRCILPLRCLYSVGTSCAPAGRCVARPVRNTLSRLSLSARTTRPHEIISAEPPHPPPKEHRLREGKASGGAVRAPFTHL